MKITTITLPQPVSKRIPETLDRFKVCKESNVWVPIVFSVSTNRNSRETLCDSCRDTNLDIYDSNDAGIDIIQFLKNRDKNGFLLIQTGFQFWINFLSKSLSQSSHPS